MKHDIQLRLVSIAFRGSLNFLRIRCWYRAFPTVMLENSTRFEYNLIPMIVLLENATYCLTLPRSSISSFICLDLAEKSTLPIFSYFSQI